MVKYHINQKTGQPGICRASTKPCPIGGDHFASKQEALENIEKQAKAGNASPAPSLKKTPARKKLVSLEPFTDPTPETFATFGKVESATFKEDSVTLNNGVQKLTFIVSGDCCSHSEIIEPEKFAKAVKGKTISSFERGGQMIDESDTSDEVKKVTDYKVTVSDGTSYTLQDANYSNGYYGTDTYWEVTS